MQIKEFDFRIVKNHNNKGDYNASNNPFLYGNEAFARLSEFIDEDVSIELWSGLYDNKGKKIYEGDILLCDGFSYIVAYKYSKFVLLEPKEKIIAGDMYAFLKCDCFQYEVISNIHELKDK